MPTFLHEVFVALSVWGSTNYPAETIASAIGVVLAFAMVWHSFIFAVELRSGAGSLLAFAFVAIALPSALWVGSTYNSAVTAVSVLIVFIIIGQMMISMSKR